MLETPESASPAPGTVSSGPGGPSGQDRPSGAAGGGPSGQEGTEGQTGRGGQEGRGREEGTAEKLGAIRCLAEIVERLRGPQGCPWDRAQTLATMAPNLLEEACEAVDAIAEGQGAPTAEVCEELGDLLMNVLLIARIAEESGAFGLGDVARGISAKLVRRHPHVFGEDRISSVEEVLTRWKAIKEAEGKGKGEDAGGRRSALGRLPRSLPALLRAKKLGERAAAVGFDWPGPGEALRKVEEEVREVEEALGQTASPCSSTRKGLRHELGDLLFAVVNVARKSGVDPEEALREANERFIRRFHSIERRTDVTRASLAEMETLWKSAKEEEPPPAAEEVRWT